MPMAELGSVWKMTNGLWPLRAIMGGCDKLYPVDLAARLSDGFCAGTSAFTTCVRVGVNAQGADKNRTPISRSVRQTISLGTSKPSNSMTKSKVVGVLIERSTCKQAPEHERFLTVQGSAE
jgi:hypothetical protein